MNILAIDAAAERFSVALAAGKDKWLFEADAGMRHSELIMDCIDILLKKASLQPKDLDGVVCMGGPGSFTGLRIGFSVAKGLALSLGIPFAPVPTLECMAHPFNAWPGIVMPVIDAKQTAFFCAMYCGGKRLCPDMDAEPAAIASAAAAAITEAPLPGHILLTGPGAELLYEKLILLQETASITANLTLGKNLPWGNARALLEIALQTNVFSDYERYLQAGPEYIRKSDAELKQQSSRDTQ